MCLNKVYIHSYSHQKTYVEQGRHLHNTPKVCLVQERHLKFSRIKVYWYLEDVKYAKRKTFGNWVLLHKWHQLCLFTDSKWSLFSCRIVHYEQRLKSLFYKKRFPERMGEVKPRVQGISSINLFELFLGSFSLITHIKRQTGHCILEDPGADSWVWRKSNG